MVDIVAKSAADIAKIRPCILAFQPRGTKAISKYPIAPAYAAISISCGLVPHPIARPIATKIASARQMKVDAVMGSIDDPKPGKPLSRIVQEPGSIQFRHETGVVEFFGRVSPH